MILGVIMVYEMFRIHMICKKPRFSEGSSGGDWGIKISNPWQVYWGVLPHILPSVLESKFVELLI